MAGEGGIYEFDLLVSLYSPPTFHSVIFSISNDIVRVVSPMLVFVFKLQRMKYIMDGGVKHTTLSYLGK